MMKIYRVTSPEQLILYEAEVRTGIQAIFASAGNPHNMSETEIVMDLAAHITDFGPSAALWFVLGDGDLKGFLSAKVYYDGPKRSAAITWMWSAMHGALTPELREILETWCREQGATTLYCSRSRGEDWFTAFVAKHGFTKDSVMYRKSLEVAHVGTQRSDCRIESENTSNGIDQSDGQAASAGSATATVRHDYPGVDGAVGAASRDGDQRAATAGGELHAEPDGQPAVVGGRTRGQTWEQWKQWWWRKHGVVPADQSKRTAAGGVAE